MRVSQGSVRVDTCSLLPPQCVVNTLHVRQHRSHNVNTVVTVCLHTVYTG